MQRFLKSKGLDLECGKKKGFLAFALFCCLLLIVFYSVNASEKESSLSAAEVDPEVFGSAQR